MIASIGDLRKLVGRDGRITAGRLAVLATGEPASRAGHATLLAG